MNHDPSLACLGLGLSRQHVLSARPDAPVVPHRPRRQRLRATRARLASGLHRLAWRIEPATGVRMSGRSA